VPASPCSSEARIKAFAWLLLVMSIAVQLAGCATVRPEEKEYLAEPSMTWTSGGMAKAHEDHVLENREGSFGGSGTKGGGCGCN
jgi:hypothetical protein